MGAVLVFEDLTAQRQLAQEKRSAEQLQLLTRVVARIADEIKNPLVSINAFMELIGERYDDATFRNQFSSVVGPRRAAPGPDLRQARRARERGRLQARDRWTCARWPRSAWPSWARRPCPRGNGGPPAHLHRRVDPEARHRDPLPRGPLLPGPGDRTMFKKAMSYLIWYLLRKTPGPEAKISASISHLAQRGPRAPHGGLPHAPRSGPRSCRRSSIRSRSSRRTSSTWARA